PLKTIVFRPTRKQNVKEFANRHVAAAIEKAGVRNRNGYSVRIQEKTNTIAVSSRNGLLTEKLLQVTSIPKGGANYEVKPYMAKASNQSRGVLYLRGGDSLEETPESLMEVLECRTHKIVSARPLAKGGRVTLITFEGHTIPKKIRFLCEVLKVAPYKPRPIVCLNCHDLGHKADVCPNQESRCGKCGHPHEEMIDCELPPRCKNCGGPHAAPSTECP
ncbi:unnamed protein product, partial [Ixodes hexagonus]